jgi:hypothetical protein
MILDVVEVEENFQVCGSQALTVPGETSDNIGLVAEDLVDASDLFAIFVDILERQTDVVGLCNGHTVFHHLHAGLNTVYQWSEAIHNIVAELVSIYLTL